MEHTCCGNGRAIEDSDAPVAWHFRGLSHAPTNFVPPVGKGLPKECLERSEVMYYAQFPEYHFSGVVKMIHSDDEKSST